MKASLIRLTRGHRERAHVNRETLKRAYVLRVTVLCDSLSCYLEAVRMAGFRVVRWQLEDFGKRMCIVFDVPYGKPFTLDPVFFEVVKTERKRRIS